MNERIKELAVQAGLEMCSCGCDMPTRQSVKFAELIIKECIDQVKLELRNSQQLLSNPPQNAGVWDACNNIRRHFGVK